MKHASKNRTLNRTRSQRRALLRGLAISLINEGQIETSVAKAKELQPQIEKLITTAKNNTVPAKRLVASRLGEPKSEVINKLFNDVAPKFSERNGGYTRIVKLGRTSGRDSAIIAFVE